MTNIPMPKMSTPDTVPLRRSCWRVAGEALLSGLRAVLEGWRLGGGGSRVLSVGVRVVWSWFSLVVWCVAGAVQGSCVFGWAGGTPGAIAFRSTDCALLIACHANNLPGV